MLLKVWPLDWRSGRKRRIALYSTVSRDVLSRGRRTSGTSRAFPHNIRFRDSGGAVRFLYSELLTSDEITTLLDEKMTEQEEKDLEEAELVTRRFCELELDADRDHSGIREQLSAVLGRLA